MMLGGVSHLEWRIEWVASVRFGIVAAAGRLAVLFLGSAQRNRFESLQFVGA
jgi:hypothetical protein